MKSDILDESEVVFALLKLLQHQDESVRTLMFDQLPVLIPRCQPSAVDYTVSMVVQNLRKSLATCTWSSPSEADAIHRSALYLAAHHPSAFFNEIFPDATGTHHDPLKWLSENYATLKTTTFIEHPEADEELVKVMEKCGRGVAEGMDKCIRALECSVGILEIWKGLVRVPGEVGIALLGTWLGGSPRAFLRYGKTGSSEAVAVSPRMESSSPLVKEGTPLAGKTNAPPSGPSSISTNSERPQGSPIKPTLARNAEMPNTKQRQPPAPIHIKRKSFTSDNGPSWHRGRRQPSYLGPATAPVSASFSKGFKRRRYDSFRPGSQKIPGLRCSDNDNLQSKNQKQSTPLVHSPTSTSANHQFHSNQNSHRNSHQQNQYTSCLYSCPIPSGPTPAPLKPAFGYHNNAPIPPTPPLTAAWQKPSHGQSPRFPRGGYANYEGRTYTGQGGGGDNCSRDDRGNRGQDMWNTRRPRTARRYMGYQHGGRWFSSHGTSDRYRGEAAAGGNESDQALSGAGGGSGRMPPKSPGALKHSTFSQMGMGGGSTSAVGGGSGGTMESDSRTHLVMQSLALPPLHMPTV